MGMKTLVLYVSVHHDNTAKLARAMAEELAADCRPLGLVDERGVEGYDLVGFGSGIYYNRPHKQMLDFVARLPMRHGHPRQVFIFTSSGTDDREQYHAPLKAVLAAHGCDVVGEWSCKAWDTWGPLQQVGGINQGHPDADDLARARAFAAAMKKRLGSGE
jgi:flavodoxin